MSRRVMIQGTMSSVGKSLLTAGLLRVLAQDGRRAAPFKSQNMALNSYVTADGREIGRAQAMQAEAAGIEVTAEMNPILLKPDSDTGSQVILNGRVYAEMTARDYFHEKKKLVPHILRAFHTLEERYEDIVIEGAGSPAEINLRQDDIVNMGLAELVDAPVLLVADIDRGGVFAQIYGTVQLLAEAERARLRGIVINKFRGDKALLQPGIDQIEALCGIPVLGVLPYLPLELDDEDSVSERLRTGRRGGGALRIAVVRLPHISNYTDLAALEAEAEVLYTERAEELLRADLLLLPGSKNTLGDLRWLRERGLDRVICRAAERSVLIGGICGGYQMLGEWLEAEDGTRVRGLALLPVETYFTEEKRLTRTHGEVCAASGFCAGLLGSAVEGYEIHMGQSKLLAGAEAMLTLTDQEGRRYTDGCARGRVFGCYLHGLFDADAFRGELLGRLCEEKGLVPGAPVDRQAYRQAQYDTLADALREHLDLAVVDRILRESERQRGEE